MSDSGTSHPKDLSQIENELLLAIGLTPRDYLDRVYNASFALMKVAFVHQRADGNCGFLLDHHDAMREAQMHIAITHDLTNLMEGSRDASTLYHCYDIFEMARKTAALQNWDGDEEDLTQPPPTPTPSA